MAILLVGMPLNGYRPRGTSCGMRTPCWTSSRDNTHGCSLSILKEGGTMHTSVGMPLFKCLAPGCWTPRGRETEASSSQRHQ